MTKRLTMEEAMVKAIRKWKRENPTFSIRCVYAAEMSGYGDNISYASFRIEYVEEAGGEYKDEYVQVYA